MFVRKSAAAIAAILAASALVARAEANVITFETAPPQGLVSSPFTGSVTEDGFTYTTQSGLLGVDPSGHPGQDMTGFTPSTGGVLEIVSAGAPDFMFESTDFAALGFLGTSQTLTVEGLLGGTLVATDSFTLANVEDTGSGPFANWTTEPASNLQGQTIDELLITLNASADQPGFSIPPTFEAVDNVTLTPVTAVPEPATWAMLLMGVGGIGAALRLSRKPLGQTALA